MLLWLLVAVAVAFVISWVTMAFIGRLARRRMPEAVEQATAGGREALRVAPMVQFYGVASEGRRQLRGSGTLVLTDEHLRFDMWSPQRDLTIPLRSVVRVDTARTHVGKYSMRPLLRVTWRTWDGLDDVAAWSLTDLDGWLRHLSQVTGDRGAGADAESPRE
jgi:hypothetical protein